MTLAVTVVLGLLAGLLWAQLQAPAYSATAHVLLTPVPSHVSASTTGRRPRLVTIDTDAHLIAHPEVVGRVARTVGLSPESVRSRLEVTAPPLTTVLRISFTAATPQTAANGANAAATGLIAARQETLAALQPDQTRPIREKISELRDRMDALDAQEDTAVVRADAMELQAQVRELRDRLADLEQAHRHPAEVIEQARPPSQPVRSNSEVPITSGLALGLLVGCAIASIRDLLQARRARSISSIS